MTRWVVLSLMALGVVAGCGRAPGTVEGDVFLMMQSGDTKRGATVPVSIAPVTAELEAEVQRFCALSDSLTRWANATTDSLLEQAEDLRRRANASREQAAARRDYTKALQFAELALQAARQPFSLRESLRTEIANIDLAVRRDSLAALFARAAVRVDTTGLDASFRLPDVPAGRYLLHAEWPIGENQYVWLAPIEIEAKTTVRRDLSNGELVSAGALCDGSSVAGAVAARLTVRPVSPE